MVSAEAALEVQWPAGADSLGFALLRAMCPCALCEARRRSGEPVRGENVSLAGIEPYGQNAVLLKFSDGHGRGIYPFSYLRSLAANARAATERRG